MLGVVNHPGRPFGPSVGRRKGRLPPVAALAVGRGQVDGHERRRRITPDPPVPRIDGPQGVDGGLVDSPVPEIGPRALLGRTLEELVALKEIVVLEESRDGGGRIVQVPGDDGPLGAHHHAGGLQSHLDAMYAVVALLGGVVHRIDVQRVIGAGLHATLATDAQAGVEVDDPVGAAEQGAGWADRDTGSIRAVIATQHREGPLGVGPGPRLDVLHPGAIHPQRDVMLGLARHRAGVTTDARRLVDDEAVLQGAPSPYRARSPHRNLRIRYNDTGRPLPALSPSPCGVATSADTAGAVP